LAGKEILPFGFTLFYEAVLNGRAIYGRVNQTVRRIERGDTITWVKARAGGNGEPQDYPFTGASTQEKMRRGAPAGMGRD